MDNLQPGRQTTQQASPQFLQTAQRLAELLVEDIGMIISGAALTYRDVKFSLKHDGALDATAMVLAIQVCPLTEHNQAQICKALLRSNFDSSVTSAGYYAIPPDTDAIVWCMRIDFDEEPDPVGKIAFLLEQLATGKEVFGDVIKQAVEEAVRRDQGPVDLV